jgi:hypothetical protein
MMEDAISNLGMEIGADRDVAIDENKVTEEHIKLAWRLVAEQYAKTKMRKLPYCKYVLDKIWNEHGDRIYRLAPPCFDIAYPKNSFFRNEVARVVAYKLELDGCMDMSNKAIKWAYCTEYCKFFRGAWNHIDCALVERF